MSDRIMVFPGKPLVASRSNPVVARPIAALPATRTPRGAWEERNWATHREGARTIYEGEYVVRDPRGRIQRFAGRVEVSRGVVDAYVADPPIGLPRHPKGACFQIVNGGPWFRCNWHRPPRTQDDAILYVEGVLGEAMRR